MLVLSCLLDWPCTIPPTLHHSEAPYDIRQYVVRDMVATSVIKLVSLRTHLMVADALTESLPSPAHIKHLDIMLGHVPFSFAARTLRNIIGEGG